MRNIYFLIFSAVSIALGLNTTISAQTTYSAGSYTELSDAISNSASGDIINITGDILDLTGPLEIGIDLTINGNSHIISVPVPGLAEQGKEILQRKLKNWKVAMTDKKINDLILFYKLRNAVDFYYLIATEKIDVFDVKSFLLDETLAVENSQEKPKNAVQASKSKTSDEGFSIGENNIDNINFSLAPCCNPLQGDDVFGFITVGKGITIHRSNCPNAKSLLEKFEYRIVKINWKKTELNEDFQSEIVISGNDSVGILNQISKVISTDLKVNMKSRSIQSADGIFTGNITVVVPTTKHLEVLMNKLSKIKGVLEVKRV